MQVQVSQYRKSLPGVTLSPSPQNPPTPPPPTPLPGSVERTQVPELQFSRIIPSIRLESNKLLQNNRVRCRSSILGLAKSYFLYFGLARTLCGILTNFPPYLNNFGGNFLLVSLLLLASLLLLSLPCFCLLSYCCWGHCCLLSRYCCSKYKNTKYTCVPTLIVSSLLLLVVLLLLGPLLFIVSLLLLKI